MSDEDEKDIMIYSKSETIGVKEERALRELTHKMGAFLTPDEFAVIAGVFNHCVDRMLEENGIPKEG